YARGQFNDANPTLFTYVASAPPRLDTLTVHVVGTGSGTVTILPGGITCSTTCSHSFEDGTALTLSGFPQSGSALPRWSDGPCSGGALCQFTSEGDTDVNVTFDPLIPTVTPPANLTTPPVIQSPPKVNTGGDASALAGCLAAAQKVYKHAVRLAHTGPRGARPAAPRKARG